MGSLWFAPQARALACTLGISCVVSGSVASAQGSQGSRRSVPAQPAPVQWRVAEGPGLIVHAGSAFQVQVTASVAAGWHLYAMDEPEGGPTATAFTVPANGVAELVSVGGDRPLRGSAESGPANFYMGQARFHLHFQLSHFGDYGAKQMPITVRYQACNDRMCLPPRSEHLGVRVYILGAVQ